MNDVYIVIPNYHVGGAEKRLVELWNEIQKVSLDNVYLVITKPLFDLLENTPNLMYLNKSNTKVKIINPKKQRYRYFVQKLLPIILKAKRGSVFHYPMMGLPFIHYFLGQEQIVSQVSSLYFEKDVETQGYLNRSCFYLSSITAKYIDVLNPKVYEGLRNENFHTSKLKLTVGSMVDTNIASKSEKNDNVVFLGRFEKNDIKNSFTFVKLLPKINKILLENNKKVKFYILGKGPLEAVMTELLAGEEYKDIDVECYFEKKPLEVLSKSKVFLSLQKYENYPSRSLLEAIACGMLPIVTDVGESRLFGNDEIIRYVTEPLLHEELAKNILEILEMDKLVFAEANNVLKTFVEQKHSIKAHVDYYLSLYA